MTATTPRLTTLFASCKTFTDEADLGAQMEAAKGDSVRSYALTKVMFEVWQFQSAERTLAARLADITRHAAAEVEAAEGGRRADASWIAQATERYAEAVATLNAATKSVQEWDHLLSLAA